MPLGGAQIHTDTDMTDALRRVAAKLGHSPGCHGSSNSYSIHKRQSEPSSAIIIQRFGSWNAALEAAGLPLNWQPAASARTNGFGSRRYKDTALWDALAAAAERESPLTVRGYERLRRPSDPCSALIRRRLREHGTWTELLEEIGAEANKARRPRGRMVGSIRAGGRS